MSIPQTIVDATGSWEGTNAFRLMPTDEPFEAPSTATVEAALGGLIVTVSYEWEHADDGPQQGVLVLANAGDNTVRGLWVDTWNQKEAQDLSPVEHDGDEVVFEYEYAGNWRWQIAVSAADNLAITMRNVVPAEEAGGSEPMAYDALVFRFQR